LRNFARLDNADNLPYLSSRFGEMVPRAGGKELILMDDFCNLLEGFLPNVPCAASTRGNGYLWDELWGVAVTQQ
jgi:hypothetical protein